MTPDKILVIIAGLIAIGFVYWFFMNKKDKKIVSVASSVDIKVEGGYSPEIISIPVGETTVLNFTRTDPTGCLDEVVLGDFNIRKELPLNKTVSISITPNKKGEFVYSCGMNMYHGKIIVE